MPYKDAEKQREAKQKYEEKRKGTRFAAWTLIFYPDSAPGNWDAQLAANLSEVHLPVWVSPVHDRDEWTEADELKNPAHKAGTLKKPHYHLVAQYPNPVTREMFLADFGFLKGPENVKQVKSLISMVRYLIHKDDPDKAQYSRENVKAYGGADIGLLDAVGDGEFDVLLAAMMDFIDENGITSFAGFIRYCRKNEITWFKTLNRRGAYIIEKYIKSNRYDMQDAFREAERKHWGQ